MTRRDFINGISIAVIGSLSPAQILNANTTQKPNVAQTPSKAQNLKKPKYYPPKLTGLRGSNDESYKYTHALRDGESYDFSKLQASEHYDLVVVGAGISGLSAALLYQQKWLKAHTKGKNKHKKPKILILDNHDDFGGHARRNEFNIDSGLLISYGGSESLQSPKALYSRKVRRFLSSIGVDIEGLGKCFDVDFYSNLGLSRGVYFSKEHFLHNKLVIGDPRILLDDSTPKDKLNAKPLRAFINDFPMSKWDKDAILELYENPKNYLSNMKKTQKLVYLAKTSYAEFLRDKVGLSQMAISFFDGSTDDFMALGIDSLSCEAAFECGLPGFGNLGLDLQQDSAFNEPYIYHFPDGNASIARALVYKLIPQVLESKLDSSVDFGEDSKLDSNGKSNADLSTKFSTDSLIDSHLSLEFSVDSRAMKASDLLLKTFDYSRLDIPSNDVNLRLSSTALNVQNLSLKSDDKKSKHRCRNVEIVYANASDNKLHKISTKHAIMACYASMIPHILCDLSNKQSEALAYNVKSSLIYTKVAIKNWRAFINLGVHTIYSPKAFYTITKLDEPVDMGGYYHPRNPNKPIILHLIGSPLRLLESSDIDDARDIHTLCRLTRHALFNTSFATLENLTKKHLDSVLGNGGFKRSDILAITVNRWGHCYSYGYNSLIDTPKMLKNS